MEQAPVSSLKHGATPRQTITIVAVGTLKAHEVDLEPFTVGQELMLFLAWVDGVQAYMIVHGPEGAYDITNGLMRPFGHCALAQSLALRTPEDVLNALVGAPSRP